MIKIAIVEDDEQLRKSLVSIINTSDGYTCSGDYVNCEASIKDFNDNLPDVILMDIELPGMSGVQGVRLIKERWPEVEIIMLTIHEDNESVYDSLRNGASGYLIKNIQPSELISCIQDVLKGGAPMSMNIARMIVNSFRKTAREEQLTKRESEVLYKLREGKSYQAIANELFISKSTVKFHIKNIYHKLHVSNKTEMFIKFFHNDLN
jgi:DNA-binding NarL/FixJ family response regulator